MTIFNWLVQWTVYPRWALCILILVAFVVAAFLAFILWFEIDSRRDWPSESDRSLRRTKR